ncbi:MAG: ribosome biogenesis/translation initiation ATPase RLI [Candidatus Hodarchaeales archaeon]|jgi:ATP-binding cassette subfamily E protein 1
MKRLVVVLQPKCSPSVCNYECISSCPVNKKSTKKRPIWAIKARDITKGFAPKAIINENRCLHERCGICINACPINAITTINIPEQTEDEKPVHKYEDSLFSLYRIPNLSRTRVTGLLGRNAIGKSTVIEILAGRIKPNGGIPNGHNIWLEELSVPGLARHLIDTYSQKNNIGFKRQNLRYMLEFDPKTVGDVLTEISTKPIGYGSDELEWLKNYLELEGIWNKKPGILSGGELQRFAVAYTFLQKNDVYLVDEPCTFLDVKQRLKLRKIFTDRISNQTPVFVVEHDLAVLDYLTDNICVLFGEPHVFGVVSRALGTKKGINSFLDGFLKEENISFRKRRISFKKVARERDWEKSTIPKLEYGEYAEKLGQFILNVQPGSLYRGEVLCGLGENGLGKTTFARALPNILAHHVTSADYEYGIVSVKPQQISRQFEGTVDEFLTNKTNRYLRNPTDKLHLLKPLGVWRLLNKPIKELSGGELQRVFIGAALGKNADIYVLDEPSAFLDSMERMKITSVIRNLASKKKCPIIVIEHDLQVVDAISDRVLLFMGKPGIKGTTKGPFLKREGMNAFLKELNITFRRDPDTGRARINKENSRLDRDQRAIGEYYYTPDKLKEY